MAWNGYFIVSICRPYLPLSFFGLTSHESNLGMAFKMETTDNKPITFSAMFKAMLSAFWAYQGWASIGFVGGEAKNANKNIPRGIAIGVLIIICMYLLVNTTYLSYFQ
jgi:APA family basic amino acid/polyamine antiporter